MANGFQGKEGQQLPEMSDEILWQVSERYMELYEKVIGEPFNKEQAAQVDEQQMKEVLEAALAKLD
jgi:phosphoribosylaminoimidazole-succinocarboxamide synthase